jgi:hypothetical protein
MASIRSLREIIDKIRLELYNERAGMKATGYEINWHPAHRKTHDFGGKQYTFAEMKRFGIDAKLNEPNCRHVKFPVVVGVTPPKYSEAELRRLRESEKELHEWNGRKYTLYELAQKLRGYEREIEKSGKLAASRELFGDAAAVREIEARLSAQREKAEALAGLVRSVQGRHIIEGTRIEEHDDFLVLDFIRSPFDAREAMARQEETRRSTIQSPVAVAELTIDISLSLMNTYLVDGRMLSFTALDWFAANGEQTSLGQFAAGPNGQNFNRHDTKILGMVNYINLKFGTNVDANIIKAMMYIESKIGYFQGSEWANGSVDVMQVLDPGNFAIYRLAATDGTGQTFGVGRTGKNYDPNEGRRYIPSDGYGLFQSIFLDGQYDNRYTTINMSILGGILWYLVKGSCPIRYNGGGDPRYAEKMDTAFREMGLTYDWRR